MLLPSLYPNPAIAPAEAIQDDVAFDASTVDRALRLSCWINTQEIKRFSAPYEEKDSDAKFTFFLHTLGAALVNGPPEHEFMQEYTQVCPTVLARQAPPTAEKGDLAVWQHTWQAAPRRPDTTSYIPFALLHLIKTFRPQSPKLTCYPTISDPPKLPARCMMPPPVTSAAHKPQITRKTAQLLFPGIPTQVARGPCNPEHPATFHPTPFMFIHASISSTCLQRLRSHTQTATCSTTG